jgi:hypothetical protein
MRMQLLSGVMVAVGLIMWSFVSSAQTSGVSPSDALVDVMVWGADLRIDANAYSPEVKAELEKHLKRSNAYRSKRARPTNSSELDMVYAADARYERRLVAVSDDPKAQALAVAYVDSLQPSYEWEGYHDGPEREAVFATEYQAAHPGGPFSKYLPLLAAHRWLCTAEAYEYEKRPADAARSQRAYEEAISTARLSSALLVRTAAERLSASGRCFSNR